MKPLVLLIGSCVLLGVLATLLFPRTDERVSPSREHGAADSGSQAVPRSDDGGLRVDVVTEDWRPFSYEEDGVVKGTSTAIVKAVFADADIHCSLRVYPWPRAYKRALDGPRVAIFAMVRTTKREPLFHWVGQVAPTDYCSVYKLTGRNEVAVRRLEDAKSYTIVTNRDSDKHQFLKAKGFDGIVLESDQLLTIKLLMSRRIDLLIMHDINLQALLKELGVSPDKLERVLVAYESRPYLAFSRDMPADVIERARESYAKLVKTGIVEDFGTRSTDDAFSQ